MFLTDYCLRSTLLGGDYARVPTVVEIVSYEVQAPSKSCRICL